jgi:hypothetical protein
MPEQGIYNLLVDVRGGVANLQQDMNKAVGILQSSGSKMNQVMTGIAQGFGQILGKGVVDSVFKLSHALNDLADKGEEVGSIAEQFTKLGGSTSSIEAARKAVLGTVSAFDLMKVANEGIARGIPNLNKNFATLAEYAGRFADATGKDTLTVLQDLTKAISTGSNKALKDFGIQVDQTGTNAEKMNEAIAKLTANMDNFGAMTDSVSNAHKAFGIAIDDAMKSVGMGINENEQLTETYRKLAEEIKSIDWKQVGTDIASMVASVASVLPSLQTVAGEVNKIAAGVRLVTGNLGPVEKANRDIQKLNTEISMITSQGIDQGASQAEIEHNTTFARHQIDVIKAQLAELKKENDRTTFLADPANNPGAPFPLNKPTTQADFGGGGGGGKGSRYTKSDADKEAERELKARLKEEEKLQKEKEKQAEELVKTEYEIRR